MSPEVRVIGMLRLREMNRGILRASSLEPREALPKGQALISGAEFEARRQRNRILLARSS